MTALHDTTDNAQGTLLANITAAAVSFTLQSGEGAEFPQPENGTADSVGDNVTLNDTGDLGDLVVGQFIRNVTDGSYAVVTVGGTNSITTTKLQEGSDNTWDSGDEWQANEFVGTFEKRDGVTGDVTDFEKVLITQRSTDLFTVRTRGFDGTVAQTFDADDFFVLHTVSNTVDDIIQVINDSIVRLDALEDSTELDIGALETGQPFHGGTAAGSDPDYTVSLTPALTAYTSGNIITFIANFVTTGSATLNVDGLGAKTIKIDDGVTDLIAGNIASGQLITVIYDGTNFVMQSPIGNPSTTKTNVVVLTKAITTANIGNSTSEINYDSTYSFTIPANELIADVQYRFCIFGTINVVSASLTLRVKLGSTAIATVFLQGATQSGSFALEGVISGTEAAGASVNVRGGLSILQDLIVNPGTDFAEVGAIATDGTLLLQFSAQWDTALAGNNSELNMGWIEKISVTAF